MTPAQLIQRYRVEVNDLEQPPLIDDATLLSYLDDAQKQFCRLTYGIAAMRGQSLSLRADQPWYSLPPGVLDVRDAWLDGRAVPVIASEHWRGPSRSGCLTLVLGLEHGKARVDPPPQTQHEGQRLELSVFRLPDDLESFGDELEIDPHHHQHLLDWVKYRAYDNHDADMFNKRKADEYFVRFQAYCQRARAEQNRAWHPAGVVTYGGL